MTDRELMQMALDALLNAEEFVSDAFGMDEPYGEAIEALRARLAQPIISDEIKDDKTEPAGGWVGDKEYWEYPKQEVALQSPQAAGYCQQKGEQIKAQPDAIIDGMPAYEAPLSKSQRIAQPEQEPVAWTPVTTRLPQYDDSRRVLCYCAEHDYGGTRFITLKASDFWEYDPDGDGEPGTPDSRTVTHWMLEDDAIAWATSATPPMREWQGLTDEERGEVALSCGCMTADWLDVAHAIEARLKEKNNA